jgi:hypothetical protein
MKTTIEHELYGCITHDDETDRVTVQRGDLEERLSSVPPVSSFSGIAPQYFSGTNRRFAIEAMPS